MTEKETIKQAKKKLRMIKHDVDNGRLYSFDTTMSEVLALLDQVLHEMLETDQPELLFAEGTYGRIFDKNKQVEELGCGLHSGTDQLQ